MADKCPMGKSCPSLCDWCAKQTGALRRDLQKAKSARGGRHARAKGQGGKHRRV